MPIYEYVCLRCNERFSVLQSINSSDNDSICPKCDSTNVKKVISTFNCSTISDSGLSSPRTSRNFGGG
jgi:putative FmdB family regulatory protein